MNDQISVLAPRSDVKEAVACVAKALTRAADGHTR
jgi:hypothetical protein